MTPAVELTIDGEPVSGLFYERLISLSITDKEGFGSDRFEAELNDGPPVFLALPRKGAVADIRLGYRETGLRSMGQYTVDEVHPECLPYRLKISGKAADLRASKLKSNQERHFDKATLGDVVSELAGEAGLQPVLSGRLAAIRYEWLPQQDETSLHFLERLARRHNALFAVKAGRLLFVDRGSGLGASGAAIGSVLLTPELIIPSTCRFHLPDRTRYGKVVAYYHDQDEAKRIEVASGDGDEDAPVFRIPETFADAAEAGAAADSRAKALKRGEGTVEVETVGSTGICAGAPLMFSGVRPGLDGVPFVIDTVTHSLSKREGFRSKISGKLYDGKSAGGTAEDVPEGQPETGSETAAPPPAASQALPTAPPAWSGASGRIDDR
ncbi:phage late control D family protein [Pannonibacter tanglangensis]|uniref:Late control protein D n=1 Tax=Pannonibacter tanglangensis TaxID=2750084 RepID=A0ABW9ZDL2_9HYPH|nr:contractile injection system protein, VgrG/Pvc8 family [Pannonibacter sp. XCT-34]NBN62771.1 late control protein D [Pannonibacter sp. XCT-34]